MAWGRWHITQLVLPGVPFRHGSHTLHACPSYPGIAVDALGGVWSCRTPKASGKACRGWAKLSENVSRGNRSRGYKRVTISVGGKPVPIEVHILVADAFHGPRPWGYETHHKNEDNWDNRPDNLEYLTWEEHRLTTAKAEEISEEEWEDIV